MSPRLHYCDLEGVIAARRHLLDGVRSATGEPSWRDCLAGFFRSLEVLSADDRRTVLVLLLVTAEELRHIVRGGQEYQARVEEALAASHQPIQSLLECAQTTLAEMIGRSRCQRRTSDRVGSIVEAIERRYAEPLTLDALARQVCRERGHVASQFRRETGFTIHRYLTRVRIRHAAELLRRGEKVEAVMLMVGYHSKKSFYSQFRAHTGHTPGTYRMTAAI